MRPVKYSPKRAEDQPEFIAWSFVEPFLETRARIRAFEPEGWAIAEDEYVESLKESLHQNLPLAQGFLEKTLDLMFQDKRRFTELFERVERLEVMLQDVLKQLEVLHQSWGFVVPIQTFAPEPYEVLSPFSAVVKSSGDGYEASFFDANVHSSGDTEEEAISNLKSAILDMFDRLSDLERQGKLGPEPTRQLKVLSGYVNRS